MRCFRNFTGFVLLLGMMPYALSGCASTDLQAVSLLGDPLYPMRVDDSTRLSHQRNLREARADYTNNPAVLDAIIWYGRRLAYMGEYRQAIEVFTEGLAIHPDNPRLLRHRGHRYITTRRFEQAINDLSQAARYAAGTPDALEPDGLPNASNQPRSTTQSNISYHLGLAHYLRGEFASALDVYQRGLLYAEVNDDQTVAHEYWRYLTLRRLDREEEALAVLSRIRPRMDVIENHVYHRLLLLYKGELERSDFTDPSGASIDNATLGYGLAMHQMLSGDADSAYASFMTIIRGKAWPAFGYIAAEAELAR